MLRRNYKGIDSKFTKIQNVIEKVRNSVFDQLPFTETDKEKLENFCYLLISKDEITDFYTGMVFAGYGENDIFPVCVEYLVENCFEGVLKCKKFREKNISSETVGSVIPFAQVNEVANILNGIHPDYQEELTDEMNKVFEPMPSMEMKNALKGLSKTKKLRIISALEKMKTEGQDNIIEKVKNKFKKYHTDSILQTVAMLPKDELANMAESLVNITSFVRKVSMDIESVGGPIDVAVISKKDGFIWIKRKHYFDRKYNPHFHQFGGLS